MIRLLLLRLLLLLVPFAFYGAYLAVTRRGFLRPHPWSWLFAAGLCLVAASFVFWGLTEGESTNGVYVAPQLVDGNIVPGHVEQKPSP